MDYFKLYRLVCYFDSDQHMPIIFESICDTEKKVDDLYRHFFSKANKYLFVCFLLRKHFHKNTKKKLKKLIRKNLALAA